MILLTIRTGKPRSTKFQAPRDLVTQTTNTSEVELPLPLLGLVLFLLTFFLGQSLSGGKMAEAAPESYPSFSISSAEEKIVS